MNSVERTPEIIVNILWNHWKFHTEQASLSHITDIQILRNHWKVHTEQASISLIPVIHICWNQSIFHTEQSNIEVNIVYCFAVNLERSNRNRVKLKLFTDILLK